MVRVPCCEKMGLKKGPWTPEEDRALVSYIQRYGHGNWRALPRQAGLLRCGKSCRLRWTNYLRPDIKRGNFTKEEEETIIKFHEMLGNRWSAIAAKLPGRTDNEIKNMWHTRLKKRANPSQSVQNSRRKARGDADAVMAVGPAKMQRAITAFSQPKFANPSPAPPASPSQSISSSATNASTVTGEINDAAIRKAERMHSSEELLEVDARAWTEALSIDDCGTPRDRCMLAGPPPGDPFSSFGPSNSNDGDINFWLKVFMDPGDFREFPEAAGGDGKG